MSGKLIGRAIDANTTITVNNVIVTTSIGIGTSSPTARLDIGSGDLNFSSTGQRITGNFSDATPTNRVMFQTNVLNSGTGIAAMTNGTGSSASWRLYGSSDPNNASIGDINITPTEFLIRSFSSGTGTTQPMNFSVGGTTRQMAITSTVLSTDSSVNVGIGTTNPAYKLDLVGSSATFQSRFGTSTTNFGIWVNDADNFTSCGSITNDQLRFFTNAVDRVTIDAVGNVGIGITSPATKLHVRDAGVSGTYTEAFRVLAGPDVANDTGAAIGIYQDGNSRGLQIRAGRGTGDQVKADFILNRSGGAIPSVTQDNVMTFLQGGNVGIGTTSPSQRLHVIGGNFLVNNNGSGDTNSGIRIVSPIATTHYNWMLAAQQNVSGAFEITPSTAVGGTTFTTPVAVFTQAGQVGIGTTSPSARLHTSTNTSSDDVAAIIEGTGAFGSGLHLKASGTNGRTWRLISTGTSSTPGAGTLGFYDSTSGLYRFVIGTNGNVGIGTTSPATKLNIFIGDGGANGTAGLRIGGTNNYESLELGILSAYGAMFRSYGNDMHYYSGHWRTVGTSASEDHSHYWYTSKSGSTNWSTAKMTLNHDGYLGINTTNPVAPLTFPSDALTRKIVLWWNGTDNNNYRFYGFGIEGSTLVYSVYDVGDNHVFFAGTSNSTRNELMRIMGDGRVGIGTTNPAARLNVQVAAPTGVGAIPSGTTAVFENAGNNYITMRHTADGGFYSGIVFLDNNIGGYVVHGDGNNGDKLYIAGYHGVEIQQGSASSVTPGARTTIGNFTSSGLTVTGTITETSSIRIKENINPITDALRKVLSMNGYTYDRIDGTAKQRAGLIAEEVEQVLPNVVQKDQEGNPSGIQYTNLIAYLIESIKELKAEIDELKRK